MNDISNYKLTFLGGDIRTVAAAARLAEKGFSPSIYGIDIHGNNLVSEKLSGTVDSGCCTSAGGADISYIDFAMGVSGDKLSFEASLEAAICGSLCVILPLPVSTDGINLCTPLDCCSCVSLDSILEIMKVSGVGFVCGGKIPVDFVEKCKEASIEVFDYYEREEFAVANAVPTAEGAVELAMGELPVTIHGSRMLVIGYGRIGKVLAKLLKELGAEVTVSARKDVDFAWIQAGGFEAANTNELASFLRDEKFDVIFNTVPVTVLSDRELSCLSKNTLIIDLASRPGGINSAAAKELGLKVIWALSLPGKVAPLTAGQIIADTVLRYIISKGGKR